MKYVLLVLAYVGIETLIALQWGMEVLEYTKWPMVLVVLLIAIYIDRKIKHAHFRKAQENAIREDSSRT